MTTEQQEASPETYVLADAIAATPPQRRILSVLGIRRNGAGALPALRTVARAAAAAAARNPSPRADRWLAIVRALVTSVATASTKCPWLDMLCPAFGHRAACDLLADPALCALLVEARERLDAWLGLHVFHALSRGGVVPVSVLDDWATLRRTGTPRVNTPTSWITAAKCMPLEEAEINKLLPTVRNERLKDALKLTLVALAADILDPDTLSDLIEPTVSTGYTADTDSSTGGEENDGPDDDTEESDVSERNVPCGTSSSLIGLLLHRGINASHRDQFGVTSIYGELPPPNLRRVCLSLTATLEAGAAADRTRAAIAEVSLKVPLSPRRTLEIPLACNNDVWLDLQARSLYWNFDRVLTARECDPDGADNRGSCKPVRIRLSDACVSRLSEQLAAQPSAKSLWELAGPGSEIGARDKWLKAYGHFLRSHGDDNYRAYAVRFARSYRSVYLVRGHGAVAAAMLGLDFATVPGGLLHYLSLSPDRISEWQMDVDRFLGLHWSSDSAVGAR